MAMAFVEFEASSLGRHGTPVEVAWAFETGEGESHLIRPAPGWTDWAASAERVHGLSRATLLAEGVPHDEVARRLVAALDGHDLYASAPSWDGKWLSALLRAGGWPRHALRLKDSDDAHRRAIKAVLTENARPAGRNAVEAVLARAKQALDTSGAPVHRALADVHREWELWRTAGQLARDEPPTTGSP